MRVFLTVAMFVFVLNSVWGQGHVVVSPVSLTSLSASAISSADAALASASGNSEFDVRIAFMTSAGGVGDRYQEYLTFKEPTDRHMEFFATPYGDALGNGQNDLAQEHQRLLERGVDTLGGGGSTSVLIVYTNVLSITDQGTSYSQKKYILYGNSLSGCDLNRFKQIEDFTNPPPDYCVASTPGTNDNYLNWISGHMTEAMGADYIITGTIAFQGEIYCNPEEFYINDQHNSVLENTSDFHPPIRLMVHPSSNVGNISWSSPSSSATLFTSGTGEYNTLNFQPAAFEQFNELVATWGSGQQSSISVLPVNFQVGVDEEKLVQQSNQLESISFTYQNNHTQFPAGADITITLTGASAYPGAPNLTITNPGGVGNIITWTPDEDACEENSVISELQANDKGLNAASEETSIRIICPFIIEDLVVKVPYTKDSKGESPNSTPIMRSANHGEELFIVSAEKSPNEDFKRLVNSEIIWEGERPSFDQFWGYLNDEPEDNEPIWRSFPDGSERRLTEYEKTDQWELNHNDYFPSAWSGATNPVISGLFTLPERSFDVNVNAFDQSKSVKLTFAREHKFTYLNLTPHEKIQKAFDKATKIKDKIKDLFGSDEHGKWRVKPVVSLSAKTAGWNEEDPASRFYFNKFKFTGAIELGVALGSSDAEEGKSYIPLIIPPVGPLHRQLPGGLGEIGVGLRGKFTLKASVSSTAKKYNYEPMLALSSWNWSTPSVTPTITMNLKLGVYVKATVEVWDFDIIAFSAGGECGPEIAASFVWAWDEDIQDYDFYIEGEMSPLQCDVTATLTLLDFPVFDFSLSEWLQSDGLGPGPYPFEFFKDD